MIKCILAMVLTIAFVGTLSAQSIFNTIREDSASSKSFSPIEGNNYLKIEESSTITLKAFLSKLTLPELEFLNSKYLAEHKKDNLKQRNFKKSKRNSDMPLSMYQGVSHPLTVSNILDVMEENNISNKIFVLAQSILETNYYKSNACLNYHNLFGLTNPRTGHLYRFTRWEDSVVAYKEFVQYKYKGGSYLSFLKKIGYAEDPRYISKVVHISRKINKDYANIID